MNTTPQWAIRTDGDLEVVDVPDPAHRLSAEPVTVPPGTDKKPTSLIDEQARAAIARGHLDPTTRYTTDAFIEGYRAGYAAAWEASGATYYLAADGTYHHTGGTA